MNTRLNASGYETLDPNPVEVPAGFRKPESLAETIQRLIRTDVSQIADKEGFDTFDEADDFEIEDGEEGLDPHTPYETIFDPILGREVTPQLILENRDHYLNLYNEAIKANSDSPNAEPSTHREPGTGESEADTFFGVCGRRLGGIWDI